MLTKALTIIFIIITVTISPASVMADASDDYLEGIKAFKANQYQLAANHFERAKKNGMKQSTLYYNLGSTYYKLGRYKKSGKSFRRLTKDPKWGALALYNLGLIAEKRGQPETAQSYFSTAYKQANSLKVKRLAGSKLKRRSSTAGPNNNSHWSGFLSGAAGSDDNAVLAPDTIINNISDEEDSFFEFLGSAGHYTRNAYRFDGAVYLRNYSHISEFNLSGISVALSKNRKLGGWSLETGGKGDIFFADGSYFSTTGTFRLKAIRSYTNFRLILKNDLSYVDGGDASDYITGLRNIFTTELRYRNGQRKFKAGYQLELNDRDDLTLINEFFSYSPTRHQLYTELQQQFGRKWQVRVRADFRTSDYGDKNVQINPDSSVTERVRDEDRFILTLRLNYQFNKRWGVFGEYRKTENDANFDRYGYESNRVLFGLENTF